MEEFQSEANKFDTVFDMVDGDNWKIGGHANTVLRPKTTNYYTLAPGVATSIELHSLWDLVKLSVVWSMQSLVNSTNRKLPKYIFGSELDSLEENDIRGVLQDIVDGKLKPLVDPASPFPFTQGGVREAMKLQKSCHAQGKVVIEISKG
jgi:NADPH:quinone reductase-like Zn-dependent oxidoreductase